MAFTKIEIDFLPVGSSQKSGDAIAIRYGNELSEHFMVVDGGDLAAGQMLVDHLKFHYGEDIVIDDAVCTHSDGDHASGLRTLIKNLPVRRLWVHQPWLHAERLNPQFKGNWSDPNLSGHLRNDCFSVIADLCDLAEEYGVELCEPFAGRCIGPFQVLAPTFDRYLSLVPQMNQTPTAKPVLEAALESLRKATASVYSLFESWEVETLRDPKAGSTSIPNETSVVLFGNVGGNRILLTGDAGIGALDEAIYAAGELGLDIASPAVVQVPHHGSRHNVGPTLLDQILGPKTENTEVTRGWAVISVAKQCPKKPYRSVTNALLRRGYKWAATQGGVLNWRHGYTRRTDIVPVTSGPFHDQVESWF